MDEVDDRVTYLSASERIALGRAALRAVPRSTHAAFEPVSDRFDPVALLQQQDDAGAWIALLLGRDGHDSLVLQMKEAQRSVLEEFAGRSRYASSGERVVAGQRIMQASSDILLGWLSVEESVHGSSRDYYVRQLRDWKGSINIEAMSPRALGVYGGLCASTLAHVHARSGDRIAIASYMGGSDAFDRAILAFSEAYAEQNERDFAALAAAIASGSVLAEQGV